MRSVAIAQVNCRYTLVAVVPWSWPLPTTTMRELLAIIDGGGGDNGGGDDVGL